MPEDLAGCHTAQVDGYTVEGHVPVAAVQRLLAERPAAIGLAVPGMPMGSPGMEMEGMPADPFNVIVFATDGTPPRVRLIQAFAGRTAALAPADLSPPRPSGA